MMVFWMHTCSSFFVYVRIAVKFIVLSELKDMPHRSNLWDISIFWARAVQKCPTSYRRGLSEHNYLCCQVEVSICEAISYND